MPQDEKVIEELNPWMGERNYVIKTTMELEA